MSVADRDVRTFGFVQYYRKTDVLNTNIIAINIYLFFLELNIKSLDEKKGKEYLHYLNEILPQIESESEFQKFSAIKTS